MYSRKLKFTAHPVCFLKISFRFTGKTRDDIRTDKRIVLYAAKFGNRLIYGSFPVASVHCFKDGIAARLYGKVEVGANLRMCQQRDKCLIYPIGIKARNADTHLSVFQYEFEHIGKVSGFAPVLRQVHTRQCYFMSTGFFYTAKPFEDFGGGQRHGFSPCKPYPAISTGIVTAVLNFQQCA